jgi:RNA polymerase-binding protein DksA
MTAATSTTTATSFDRQDVLRERLEQERADLLAQIEAFEPAPSTTATTGSGETEHIVSGIELGLQSTLDAQAATRLEEIDDALVRLQAGTFGFCERCGAEISGARLEAMPHARLCVSCQREVDTDRRRR